MGDELITDAEDLAICKARRVLVRGQVWTDARGRLFGGYLQDCEMGRKRCERKTCLPLSMPPSTALRWLAGQGRVLRISCLHYRLRRLGMQRWPLSAGPGTEGKESSQRRTRLFYLYLCLALKQYARYALSSLDEAADAPRRFRAPVQKWTATSCIGANVVYGLLQLRSVSASRAFTSNFSSISCCRKCCGVGSDETFLWRPGTASCLPSSY